MEKRHLFSIPVCLVHSYPALEETNITLILQSYLRDGKEDKNGRRYIILVRGMKRLKEMSNEDFLDEASHRFLQLLQVSSSGPPHEKLHT